MHFICVSCALLQVLTESTSQYKSFYNMPLLPEVRAWDPDAEVPNRDAGHFFFVQPTNLPGVSSCRLCFFPMPVKLSIRGNVYLLNQSPRL